MLKTENTVIEPYFEYTVEGFNSAKQYLITYFNYSEDIVSRMDSYEVVTKANSYMKANTDVENTKPQKELIDKFSHYYKPVSFHDYLENPEIKRYDYNWTCDEIAEGFQTYMLDEFDLEFTTDDANRIIGFLKCKINQ